MGSPVYDGELWLKIDTQIDTQIILNPPAWPACLVNGVVWMMDSLSKL